MNIGSIFTLCFIIGVLSKLPGLIADSKTPGESTLVIGVAVALIGGSIWLWLAQNLLAWVLAGFIVFGILCIGWFIGAVGAVAGLFSQRAPRD